MAVPVSGDAKEMDKYEFNIKVEQIKKMVSRGDYGTAMKIADTIDWHRVRNASLLSMIAQIYEKNEEYQEAKDILLLAFERAPVGKRLLYKLADLALKDGSTAEAEAYYREFCDLAQDDPRQYLLRYKILKAKKAPVDQLIRALEVYTSSEVDEKWLYELAELYHKAGIEDKCPHHALIRPRQICGQGDGSETSVCTTEQISDGPCGEQGEIRGKTACCRGRIQRKCPGTG